MPVPEYIIDDIKQKYPYGLLVSTRLREPSVKDNVPFHFGTVPFSREAKEWRFKTLEDRKTFRNIYADWVLSEMPVSTQCSQPRGWFESRYGGG